MDKLTAYLNTHKPKKGLARIPHYSAEGDSLTFYFKSDPSYRERVDDFLTVFKSMETNNLVGCQVKGLPQALKLLGDFGLTIEDKSVRLSMIFMACMAATPSPEPETKERYVELGKIAKDTLIPAYELAAVLA